MAAVRIEGLLWAVQFSKVCFEDQQLVVEMVITVAGVAPSF